MSECYEVQISEGISFIYEIQNANIKVSYKKDGKTKVYQPKAGENPSEWLDKLIKAFRKAEE